MRLCYPGRPRGQYLFIRHNGTNYSSGLNETELFNTCMVLQAELVVLHSLLLSVDEVMKETWQGWVLGRL